MKRGQGAMEYLMTYGWAILVVLIVGIVLWKTGLFGTSATGQSGFNVLVPAEWKVAANTSALENNSKIIFRNVAGKTLTRLSFVIEKDGVSVGTVNPSVTALGPGREMTANFTADCTSGSSVKLDVEINYTSNGLSHTDNGIIYADCE